MRAAPARAGRLRLRQRVSARTCNENQSSGDDNCSRHHFFPRLSVVLRSVFLRRRFFSFQASSRIHHVFESLSRAADPDNPERGEETAAKMLRRMLLAGISRWHPDPMAALDQIDERRQRSR